MSATGDPRIFRRIPKFVVRKDNLKVINPKPQNAVIIKSFKKFAPLYKEDVIYQSVPGDFLRLSDKRLTLVNRMNLITKLSYIVARTESHGIILSEKTSEDIVNLIGRENYNLVFTTLHSVFSQELKIRAILALLTVPKNTEAPTASEPVKVMVATACQTEESSFDIMMKPQPRRRVRRQCPTPYVVQDKPVTKKVVIHPSDFNSMVCTQNIKSEPLTQTENSRLCAEFEQKPRDMFEADQSSISTADTGQLTDADLPVLNIDQNLISEHDTNSRDSMGGLSMMSGPSIVLHSPFSVFNNIDKVTQKETLDGENSTKITLLDGTVISIPVKIEDDFHVATPEVLKYVPRESWKKLLLYQLYMDWKLCLSCDEDKYLAIHSAVLSDDVDLVRRQCLVLKSKEVSVDIATGDNTTALQLSILGGSPRCTATLLQHGADPLVTDEDDRTCFHLAAEADAGHLQALLAHCKTNPMQVLKESEELWKPELTLKPKEYQTSYLLNAVMSLTDEQGYTPLMLACKLGRHGNIQALIDAAPNALNKGMPTSGNTALHLAVESACHDSIGRGNKSTVSEDFKKTITLLIDNGASHSVQNHSGIDVNTLLVDFNNVELSYLVSKSFSYVNTRKHEPLIIVKTEDGTLNAVDVKEKSFRTAKDKATTDDDTGRSLLKNTQNDNKNTPQQNKKTLNDVKNASVLKKSIRNDAKSNPKQSNSKNISQTDAKSTPQHSSIRNDTKNTPQRKSILLKNNPTVQNTKSILNDAKTTFKRKSILIDNMNKTLKKNPVNIDINTDASTSNSGEEVQEMGKKLFIVEDKIISPVKILTHQNQYLNSFKSFVDSSNKRSLLKRKADEQDAEEVFEAKISHPRVKSLRKNSLLKIDLESTGKNDAKMPVDVFVESSKCDLSIDESTKDSDDERDLQDPLSLVSTKNVSTIDKTVG